MAVKMCPELTRMDILKIIRNAIEISFIHNPERKKLIMKFEKQIFIQMLKKN
jgi:adenosine deaminase